MSNNDFYSEKNRCSHLAVISSHGNIIDIRDVDEIIKKYENDLHILYETKTALMKNLESSKIKAILDRSLYLSENILLGYTKKSNKVLFGKYIQRVQLEIEEYEITIDFMKIFSKIICELVDSCHMIDILRNSIKDMLPEY